MFNLATGGRSPSLSFDELAERGFDLVVVPGLALIPAIRAMRDAAAAVLTVGSDELPTHYGMPPHAILGTVGLERWLQLDDEGRVTILVAKVCGAESFDTAEGVGPCISLYR